MSETERPHVRTGKRRPFNKLNKAQLIRVYELLKDTVTKKDDGFVEYIDDWSDAKIADLINAETEDHKVSHYAIAGTRLELFGKLQNALPPVMAKADEVSPDVTALQAELDAAHREIAELRSVVALINDRVEFLEKELGVVRQQKAA